MKRLIVFIITLLAYFDLTAQPHFPSDSFVFDDNSVPEMQIWIDPDSLNAILANVESDHEYPAKFIFHHPQFSDTVYNVGFRLRGNTSRFSEKKSWKISINTFEQGKKFMGLEKLNINGEHNDPTVMRSGLCLDLCRKMEIPAPRSNHVIFYINGDYIGLHANVEHIDEAFVKNRFGNNDGNLYKCYWGSDLTFISNKPDDYKNLGYYELKTNTGEADFSDLAELIRVLNKTHSSELACRLRDVFNVDDYLKSMAMDILTGNWDGPLINKNNFYLYRNTETGKFEYIPYDLDNTFGIDWLGEDWGTLSVYNWTDNPERPLFLKLMQIKEFRDLLSYYMDEIMNDYFKPSVLNPRIDEIAQQIRPYILTDQYYPLEYGYSITDFDNGLISGLPGGSGHDDAYGLKDWIATRRAASIDELQVNDIKVVIQYIDYSFDFEKRQILFQAKLWDDIEVLSPVLQYYIDDDDQVVNEAIFYDDGSQNDKDPGDGIYACSIQLNHDVNEISYRLKAWDGNEETIVPCDFLILNFGISDLPLFINEIMASNENSLADEFSEFDDWIELYNGGSYSIYLGDMYLTDNPDQRTKWNLPDISIEPGEFLLFWADEDQFQGEMHMNFKLDADGEFIGLFDSEENDHAEIDAFSFDKQTTDRTYGYRIDGFGSPVHLKTPTPGESNDLENYVLYPNPNNGKIFIHGKYFDRIRLISMGSRIVSEVETKLSNQYDIPAALGNGMYIFEFRDENAQWHRQSILIFR